MNTNILCKVVVISLSVLLYYCCTAMEIAGDSFAGNGLLYHPFLSSEVYQYAAISIAEAYKDENLGTHRIVLETVRHRCEKVLKECPEKASSLLQNLPALCQGSNDHIQSSMLPHIAIVSGIMYKKARKRITKETCRRLADMNCQEASYGCVIRELYPTKHIIDCAYLKEIDRLTQEVCTLLLHQTSIPSTALSMDVECDVDKAQTAEQKQLVVSLHRMKHPQSNKK